ncbi:F-box domain-containing protein [Mycena sanguinolenta]|uniref:F-box domain-containing protein n=1 Tax=Mycena sanguinolenta TaxID=230812 RepID=A0A8H6U3K8_9AGAR|nr:F-box domain-containing protein [Mycena sanguinolenta]
MALIPNYLSARPHEPFPILLYQHQYCFRARATSRIFFITSLVISISSPLFISALSTSPHLALFYFVSPTLARPESLYLVEAEIRRNLCTDIGVIRPHYRIFLLNLKRAGRDNDVTRLLPQTTTVQVQVGLLRVAEIEDQNLCARIPGAISISQYAFLLLYVLIATRDAFKLSLTTDPWTLARLSQLSSTNEPPLEPELTFLRPIVEKTRARLATLNAEISRLKNRLRELKDERTALSEFHSQNTRIISPVRRIPAEILGEIFSWTLPSMHEGFDTEECPWVLTHVCRRWRAVALSTPSLWSLITIDFSNEQKYPLQMIRLQLKRARSLKVHFFGEQIYESGPQITLFKLLAGYCARWEELSIRLISDLVPHLRTLYPAPTALRKVWIQWDMEESQPSTLHSVDFLRTAISLVDIGVHCQYRFIPTQLPMFHRLTRYDFDAPWTTHAELLKSLPNLIEVRIRRDFDRLVDWPIPGKPIDLLRLRRLFVNDSTTLDYLRAPSAEEIAIQFPSDADTDSAATLRSLERFLACSSCSPHRFCVQGWLETETMAAILQKFPCFTEIAVTDEEDDEGNIQDGILSSFLALFTISESTSSTMIFPHITTIGFAYHSADVFVCPLFLNMLESRWNMGDRTLKCSELLFVGYHTNLDPRSLVRIKTLQDAGLGISLLLGQGAQDRVDRWLHVVEWT